MNRNNKGIVGFLKSNGFYVVLVVCVIAAGVSSYLAVDTLITQLSTEPENSSFITSPPDDGTEANRPQSDVPISTFSDSGSDDVMVDDDTESEEETEDVIATEENASSDDSDSVVIEENSEPVQTATQPQPSQETAVPVTPDSSSNTPVAEQPTFVMPVDGEIIGAFSSDELVYNETMDDWRTHNGVDIAAEKDTPVLAAVTGKVTEVYYDDMWGGVVVIQSNDVTLRYAGLNAEMAVKKDQDVTAGTAIGRVGELPYELSMQSHIHIEALRGDTLFDFTELEG